jgi:hypothetical protein
VEIRENADGRVLQVFVNGEGICGTDYDELGWTGLDVTRNLAVDIAQKLGCDLIFTDYKEA